MKQVIVKMMAKGEIYLSHIHYAYLVWLCLGENLNPEQSYKILNLLRLGLVYHKDSRFGVGSVY